MPKAITAYAKRSRRTDDAVSALAGFMLGSGDPALWVHDSLSTETRHWMPSQFGAVPRTFFDQMSACVQAGHLVSVESRPELPASFIARRPQTDARISLITGSANHCFLPESQRRTFEFLQRFEPRGRHSLHVVPGYGHHDLIIGRQAHRDCFPTILTELAKTG